MTEQNQHAHSGQGHAHGHGREDHQDHHGHEGDHGGHATHAADNSPNFITQGHRTHHFDPARVERLVSDDRRQMLQPEQMLRAAGVAEGQVVVDLGAGPGFLTLPAARMAGDAGRVYAVDVSPPMLEVCRRRADEAGIHTIEAVVSDESQVPLPDAIADRVIIAFVLHEADDIVALLRESARLLRSGGEIAVAEWLKTEGTPGPPLDHRVGQDDLAGYAAQAGLRPVPTDFHNDNCYLVRLAR